MALSETGPISFNDLNLEVRGVSNEEISLALVSSGAYIPINENSLIKPDGIAPHSMSEFRGYDQSASASLTEFGVDSTIYGDDNTACIVGMENNVFYHNGVADYPDLGDLVYFDVDGDVLVDDGWYWMNNNFSINVSGGEVISIVECR